MRNYKTFTIEQAAGLGLLAALLVILVCVLSACCTLPNTREEHGRDAAQQDEAAVAVVTNCGIGSGVMLDGTHVITALHVIMCDGKPAQNAVVRSYTGMLYAVSDAFGDAGSDVARLDIVGYLAVDPIRVRPVKTGETLCASVVDPERARTCGIAEGVNDTQRPAGDVTMSDGFSVWFGNSGGGVYGLDGELVGVVTRMAWCKLDDMYAYNTSGTRPAKTCGGRVASIPRSVLP